MFQHPHAVLTSAAKPVLSVCTYFADALGIGYAPKGMMKGYVAITIRSRGAN
jgi:hypothetical protein